MFVLLQGLVRDKKKLAAVCVGLVIFLYFDFTSVASNQIKGLREIKQRIVSLRKDIETLNSDIAYVKKSQQSIAAPLAVKKLPQEAEIPSLMQNISAIANNNGIRIMQIDSSKDVSKGAKSTAARTKKVAVAGKQKELSSDFTAVMIKLEIIGGYHKLGNFVNDLENAGILCIIDEFTLGRDQSDPLKQKVNMIVKTYVKK
jgi:Tfp pilus assembly protein PilO